MIVPQFLFQGFVKERPVFRRYALACEASMTAILRAFRGILIVMFGLAETARVIGSLLSVNFTKQNNISIPTYAAEFPTEVRLSAVVSWVEINLPVSSSLDLRLSVEDCYQDCRHAPSIENRPIPLPSLPQLVAPQPRKLTEKSRFSVVE